MKQDQTESNLPYDIGEYGSVPIYSEKSISRYELNNAKASFQQSLEETNVFTLVCTYYTIENDLEATLMLNNKGATITVYPSVYSLAGTKLELDPVVINNSSYREFDLREMLTNAGTEFEQGSLQMTYNGLPTQLGSQVKIVDTEKSLIWDEQLFKPSDKHISKKLEGVWWFPSANNIKTKFIISNTSDEAVRAKVVVDGASTIQSEPTKIDLEPHETKVLDVLEDLVGDANATLERTGGISIKHNGTSGAILAKMLISKPNKGYSSTMFMTDPKIAKSKKLHGAGLRLGKIAGEDLKQLLVARNTGDELAKVKEKIIYTNENDEIISINIPSKNIAPNKTKTINLRQIINSANIPASVEIAGIEMKYNTQAGSVLINVINTSENGNHVFDTLMLDPENIPSSASGFPWKVDGDFTTVVYIKNETDEERKFTATLNYQGGQYGFGLKKIKAHQTIAIDFKQLRDDQTPDDTGNIIPLNIESGQIDWGSYGRDSNKTLTGNSELVSISKGISSTYNCWNCCPPSHYSSRLDPDATTGTVDGTAEFSLLARNQNCHGQVQSEFTVNNDITWSSSDTNVATCTGGIATGVGVGQAGITAIHEIEYYNHFGGVCQANFFNDYALALCDIVQPPIVTNLTANVPVSNLTGPNTEGITTTNNSLAFSSSSTDMFVGFKGGFKIAVLAQGVSPASASTSLRWLVERDPSDPTTSDMDTGLPTITGQGASTIITPNKAGNFHLILWFDTNNVNQE